MASGEFTSSECLSSYTICEKHKNEQIEKFCDIHNALLCKLCEVNGHKTCAKVTIKDKSKQTNQKRSVGALLKSFQSLEDNIKLLKTQQETNKKTLVSEFTECHREVQKIKGELYAHFDELDTSLTHLIQKLEQEQLARKDSQIKACEHSIKEIEKEIGKLKACESIGDEEIIFVGQAKSLPFLENCKETYDILKKKSESRHPAVLYTETTANIRRLNELAKVVEYIDVKAKSDWVTGSTFLPDGRLVVSSKDPPTLFIFAADGTILSSTDRSGRSIHGVTAIISDKLVCTVPDKRELHFIDVDDRIPNFRRKIKTHMPCYGIGVMHDKLYVSCHGGAIHTKAGEVTVLSMDGNLLKRFNSETGCSFVMPVGIFADEIESTVYVIDGYNKELISIKEGVEGGPIVSRINLDMTTAPNGICKVQNDRLIVAEQDGLLFINGTTVEENSCLYHNGACCSVSYRKRDGALFVSGYGHNMSRMYWFT